MSNDTFKRIDEKFNQGDLWALVEPQVRKAAKAAARHATADVIEQARWLTKDGHVDRPLELVFRAWWDALKFHEGLEWAHLHPTVVFLEGHTYRIDLQVAMDAHPGTYGAEVWTPYPNVGILFDDRPGPRAELPTDDFHDRRTMALIRAEWVVRTVGRDDLERRPEDAVRYVMQGVREAWGGFWSAYWRDLNQARARRA